MFYIRQTLFFNRIIFNLYSYLDDVREMLFICFHLGFEITPVLLLKSMIILKVY